MTTLSQVDRKTALSRDIDGKLVTMIPPSSTSYGGLLVCERAAEGDVAVIVRGVAYKDAGEFTPAQMVTQPVVD